jgi:hypothetical protein
MVGSRQGAQSIVSGDGQSIVLVSLSVSLSASLPVSLPIVSGDGQSMVPVLQSMVPVLQSMVPVLQSMVPVLQSMVVSQSMVLVSQSMVSGQVKRFGVRMGLIDIMDRTIQPISISFFCNTLDWLDPIIAR